MPLRPHPGLAATPKDTMPGPSMLPIAKIDALRVAHTLTQTGPTIIKRNKALSVGPLKASATLGATLAFLGMRRSIPMLHGSQGCTAFGKIFFIQHFREPMPMQTTAMDQVSTIMGGDESIVEGLATLCAKHQPALIGIPTTGLVETQGADVSRAIQMFRDRHPEYAEVAVVPVASPDYSGCLETGFNSAVKAIITPWCPRPPPPAPVPVGARVRSMCSPARH